MEQIKVKIKIKGRLRPFLLIVSSRAQIQKMIDEMNGTNEFLTFGGLIINKSLIEWCVIDE